MSRATSAQTRFHLSLFDKLMGHCLDTSCHGCVILYTAMKWFGVRHSIDMKPCMLARFSISISLKWRQLERLPTTHDQTLNMARTNSEKPTPIRRNDAREIHLCLMPVNRLDAGFLHHRHLDVGAIQVDLFQRPTIRHFKPCDRLHGLSCVKTQRLLPNPNWLVI